MTTTIVEYKLLNNKTFSKSNDNFDFVSMVGGKIKNNLSTKKLIKILANELNNNNLKCALTPNMRKIEKFGLYLDFDFKDLTYTQEQLVKMLEISNQVLSIIYKNVKDIEYYIYTKKNNLHIYSNVLVDKEIMCFFIKKYIELFEKEIMENKNTTGGDIIDNLNGYNTGIRLEGFNKVNNRVFVEDSHYKLSYEYSEESLLEINNPSNIDLLTYSCYYDITIGDKIELELNENINTLIEEERTKTLDKKASMERFFFEDINEEILKKLVVFFNTMDKELLTKVFNNRFNFLLTLCLKNFLKSKRFNPSNTADKLNNEFFGQIIDIDNNFKDTERKISYRKHNKTTIIRNFNTFDNISFGHLIVKLEEVDTELAQRFRKLLEKENEDTLLDEMWIEFKKKNKVVNDNYNPKFLKTLLDKLYPLNEKLALKYLDKHFIYIQQEDCYYNVNVETQQTKNTTRTDIKLEEYKESFFRKCKLLGNDNKSKTLSSVIEESDMLYKYSKIVFDPSIQKQESVFNLFTGFGYKDINCHITEEHINNFNNYLNYLLKYVCENNQDQFDYLMSHCASIIQKTDFKNHICPILYSDEKGTGKSSFTKLLRLVYGDKYSFSGNIDEVLEKHSTASEFKFLNVIEELDCKNAHKMIETLKNKIQADVSNINRKFKNVKETKDYTRYFLLTNNRIQVLDRNHRRFVCYHFKKVKTQELLNLITEVYEKNINIYAKLFGEYLKNYNIKHNSRESWIKNRKGSDKINLFVKTSIIEELLEKIYTRRNLFIEHKMKDNQLEINTNDLYELYVNQAKGFAKKLKAFKDDIKENYLDIENPFITEIEHNRSSKNTYRIDLVQLHNHLVKCGLVDNQFSNNYLEDN